MSAPTIGSQTPWGRAQTAREFPGSNGCVIVSTASHGGLWVPPELRPRMPEGWRTRAWFEEDCEIAIPIYFLDVPPTPHYPNGPEHWTDDLLVSLQQWHPEVLTQ
jgi:hypothetical protein